MSSGNPKFVYVIPDEPWVVVITSKAAHFYFNTITKESFWQLSDFEDGEKLAGKIDYNAVLVLIAKSNGLSLDGDDRKRSTNKKSAQVRAAQTSDLNVETVLHDNKLVDKVLENYGYIQEASEKDYEDQHEYFEKQVEDEVDDAEGHLEEQSESAKQIESKSAILNLGYSSDSDCDSDSGEVEKGEIEKNNNFTEQAGEMHEGDVNRDNDEVEVEDSDEDSLNNGLNLLLSDDEQETNTNQESDRNQFLDLLESMRDGIDIYDPWFLVQEDHINEFASNSAYFSLSEADREEVYNEWIKQKIAEESINSSKEKNMFAFAGDIQQVFPTPKQEYLNFLQVNKDDVKLVYSEFKKATKTESDLLADNLSSNSKETIFRQFKAMLQDFKEFSKKFKKSMPNANMKVVRLNQFLEASLNNGNKYKDTKHSVEFEAGFSDLLSKKKEKCNENGELISDEFYNLLWYLVCNYYQVSKVIAENPWNYVLGPQKRLQAYVDKLFTNNCTI